MRHNKINSSSHDNYMIQEVDVWNSSGVQSCVDIAVKNGKVLKIGKQLPSEQYQDFLKIPAKGLVLLPAGVDAQVHLRVPGQPEKETAESGLWAAVAGGVGALLTMPNTKPVLDQEEVFHLAKKELAPSELATGVKVLLSAAMTMGQKGKECVDFEALAKAGVSAFTDDGVGVADDSVMLKVIEGAAKTGLPILQHAEVPGHGAVLASGPVQAKIGGPAYPAAAEIDMVARDLRLVDRVKNVRYHVLHVSSAETLKLVKSAKQKGLHVTCEVSPHHLYFTSNDIQIENSSFKMNPPLRGPEDRVSLRAALADGDCDFMATDHAPHESRVKTENFKTSAFGTTGLETSLRVLIDLWQKKELSSERLVETWSTKPAEFLGVSGTHGAIKEGFPFNAVLCDVKAQPSEFTENKLVGLSHNSCFIGAMLPGKIKATLLGCIVHRLD